MPSPTIKGTSQNWVRSNMAVKVVTMTEQGINQEAFPSLQAALQVYPTLDPWKSNEQFTWGLRDSLPHGETCIRFEDHQSFKRLSK